MRVLNSLNPCAGICSSKCPDLVFSICLLILFTPRTLKKPMRQAATIATKIIAVTTVIFLLVFTSDNWSTNSVDALRRITPSTSPSDTIE